MTQTPTTLAADDYAYVNPAFCAFALHHFCRGYEDVTIVRDDAFRYANPVWGMLTLALLAPRHTREQLPKASSRRLTNLFEEHPEWRNGAPIALRAWSQPFWDGVLYGSVLGTLKLVGGRLGYAKKPAEPADAFAREVKKKAKIMGTVVANEGSDVNLSMIIGVVIGE